LAAFRFSVKELAMAFQEFTTSRGILAAASAGAGAAEFWGRVRLAAQGHVQIF